MSDLASPLRESAARARAAGARARADASGVSDSVVAHAYGRRDWLMRRLLAASDAICLGLAITLVTAANATGAEEVLCGLATLPGWVVLFKVYGLYERDAKRLEPFNARRYSFALSCSSPWDAC